MRRFLHFFCEELRTHEKFMEDVHHHPMIEIERTIKDEHEALSDRYQAWRKKLN